MPLSRERKVEYFGKMKALLDSYTKVFIVQVDNVGSKQMQQTRAAMRKDAEILMGKNTLMRKVIKEYLKKNPGHPYKELSDQCKGNVGFVFTNSDLAVVRDKILANRVPAPARVGAIAPIDVVVPAGPTGCDPGQTAFFQTLQIGTKITKGQIEIISNVNLLKRGDKVGSSEAALLQKLNIRPFTYGFTIQSIYDNGAIFSPEVLDITPDKLVGQFFFALSKIAALSIQIGYPTQASFPHSVGNAFKTLVAITVELENYSFAEAAPYEAFVKDPTAFAAAAVEVAPDAGAGATAAPAPVAEVKKEEEPEEEIDLGGGMDMFGGEAAGGGDY